MGNHLANDAGHTEGERAFESSHELDRPNARHKASTYGLQLSHDAVRNLVAILGENSLHYAVGFLTGAVAIPEPISWESCLETLTTPANEDDFWDCHEEDDIELADEEDDVEFADKQERVLPSPEESVLLRALYDQVQQRVAQNAVASLLPSARDADACDQWITGLRAASNQTLHDLTDEEGEISLRLFAAPDERTPLAERKVIARRSLAADVLRLIELWREVPPYDPAMDDESLWEPAPLARAEPPERVFHEGGTYVRTGPKVGRNDLCPCGSGKKFKKCCA